MLAAALLGGFVSACEDADSPAQGDGGVGGNAATGGAPHGSEGGGGGGALGGAGGAGGTATELTEPRPDYADVGFPALEGYALSNCLETGVPTPGAGASIAVAGETCAQTGALACGVAPWKEAFLCAGGEWTPRAKCDAASNCNAETGVCEPLEPACASRETGSTYCDDRTVHACSFDQTVERTAPCCGTCAEGHCEAPRCGDGLPQAPEECDDGNDVGGDACDRDCRPPKVSALAAGRGHTCALLRSGAVRCWGDNRYGQLGLGHARDMAGRHPYEVGEVQLGGGARLVRVGGDHSCAIMRDDSLQCWGRNDLGQLGLGHRDNVGDDEVPNAADSRLRFELPVVDVALGEDTTCAVLEGGEVRCWGNNQHGQLGQGHTQPIGDDEEPTAKRAEVPLDAPARLVSVDGDFACAVMGEATVQCWGYNDHGELGLGTTGDVGDDELPTPEQKLDFSYNGTIGSIASGGWHTYATFPPPAYWIRMWGYNGDGSLGIATTGGDPASAFTRGSFPFGEAGAVLGDGHTCSQWLQQDTVTCWGSNDKGQLGYDHRWPNGGSPGAFDGPVDWGLSPDLHARVVRAMAAGAQHTCALMQTDEVLCWGWNDRGQLGLGYASPAPDDYVGGTAETVPARLPAVRVLP